MKIVCVRATYNLQIRILGGIEGNLAAGYTRGFEGIGHPADFVRK